MHLNNSTAITLALIILVLVCGFGAWLSLLVNWRLRRWARLAGLSLVEKRRVWFLRGPFTWTAARNDFVYRIRAKDRSGTPRQGWARLSAFALMTGGPFQIVWIGEKPNPVA